MRLLPRGGEGLASPLISMRSSTAIASPVTGSVPFSSMNLTASLLSKTCLEGGERTGSSGTSPLTAEGGEEIKVMRIPICNAYNHKIPQRVFVRANSLEQMSAIFFCHVRV